MSNEGIAGCSMERCLEDMPYEILFEIFRNISKIKLIEISKLCSRFREITEDRRLWKDVYIKYESIENPTRVAFAFEELYSGPWAVKVIDLKDAMINRPVYSQPDQEVKVTKLILPSITDIVTIEAILTKYQCTELYLSLMCIENEDHVLGLKPKALLEQTFLKVLSIRGILLEHVYHHWLTQVLNYFKHLKTLDLSGTYFTNIDVLSFVKKLPTSLEKLFLGTIRYDFSEDLFFSLLAERTPNLRELGLYPPLVKCSSLHKFQFLEILRVTWNQIYNLNISDFHMHLKKFPALKTVHIVSGWPFKYLQELGLEELQRTLEPHGIIVRLIEVKEGPSVDDNLWEVSKTV